MFDYVIVCAESVDFQSAAEKLSIEVTSYLKDGYSLHGSLIVYTEIVFDELMITLAQPVTIPKINEEEKK